MKLVSFGSPRAWVPGIDIGDAIVDTRAAAALCGWSGAELEGLTCNRQLLAQPFDRLLSLDSVARTRREALTATGKCFQKDSVRLGPPIPNPEKIICIGLNYHDHAAEVGAKPPAVPMFFAKYANSLIGDRDDVIPPRDTQKVDYEAELAVVIGKPGRYIDAEHALNHVAGAMPFNDLSARDLQLANNLWTGGKAIDTFAPCGPALVTLDEAGDLQDMSVQTRVGGDLLQNGNTSAMIFGVPQLIAFLSRIMTLVPGDIIATGTPAGVAMAHKPPRFLQTGDEVEITIARLGTLKNTVRAPT